MFLLTEEAANYIDTISSDGVFRFDDDDISESSPERIKTLLTHIANMQTVQLRSSNVTKEIYKVLKYSDHTVKAQLSYIMFHIWALSNTKETLGCAKALTKYKERIIFEFSKPFSEMLFIDLNRYLGPIRKFLRNLPYRQNKTIARLSRCFAYLADRKPHTIGDVLGVIPAYENDLDLQEDLEDLYLPHLAVERQLLDIDVSDPHALGDILNTVILGLDMGKTAQEDIQEALTAEQHKLAIDLIMTELDKSKDDCAGVKLLFVMMINLYKCGKGDFARAKKAADKFDKLRDGPLRGCMSAIEFCRLNIRDSFLFLGIKKTASDKEITSAYRQLATKYHPDKLGDKETEFTKAMMKRLNNVYDTLLK